MVRFVSKVDGETRTRLAAPSVSNVARISETHGSKDNEEANRTVVLLRGDAIVAGWCDAGNISWAAFFACIYATKAAVDDTHPLDTPVVPEVYTMWDIRGVPTVVVDCGGGVCSSYGRVEDEAAEGDPASASSSSSCCGSGCIDDLSWSSEGSDTVSNDSFVVVVAVVLVSSFVVGVILFK